MYIFRWKARFPLHGVWKIFYRLTGMKIRIITWKPDILVAWPNQGTYDHKCNIWENISLKSSGDHWCNPAFILKENNIFIGGNCGSKIIKGIQTGYHVMIGSGTKYVNHEHGTESEVPVYMVAAVAKKLIDR